MMVALYASASNPYPATLPLSDDDLAQLQDSFSGTAASLSHPASPPKISSCLFVSVPQ